MGLTVDHNNAWDVAYTLVQLLPLEERIKYELLGADSVDVLVREMEIILNEISGED